MSDYKSSVGRVLVSGASGDIGAGVGRILLSEGVDDIYGCDIDTDSWGACIFKTLEEVPRADSDKYLEAIKALINKYDIDVFIPSSEAEIGKISALGGDVEAKLDCLVLMADITTVCTSLNKLSTANFLQENNIDSPWTRDSKIEMPLALPCIFKPISGQGSKGLEVVADVARAETLFGTEGYIFQELLEPENQEYTCGVYRYKSGLIRTIIIRRQMDGGFTSKGVVIDDKKIERYLNSIAESLNVNGAINMQLRLTDRGPVLFEINPRFSSTVVFRHKLGFRDLLWSLEEKLKLPLSAYVKPIAGITFYRGLSEYFKK